MASINEVLTPSRVTLADTEFKTTVKEWPNGRISAKRNWAIPKHEWNVEWDGLSLAQYTLLCNHFKQMFGRWGVFQFTDTHDGVTYNVRYADDRLSRRNVRPNTGGLYLIKVKIEEDKE